MTATATTPSVGAAPAVSPLGRFFANQTFHFETLRNAGYILAGAADLGEVLETVKLITEGDVQGFIRTHHVPGVVPGVQVEHPEYEGE